MTEAPITKKKRWGRRLLFLVLLLAIVVTSTVLWLGSVAGSRLEAELAHVRDAGEPITLAELAPAPVPESENAAPLLLEAFELAEDEPDAWHEGITLEAYENDPFGQEESWYAELAAWVEKNEPALGKAREAGARPACRFDLQWEKGIEMESPQVWGLLTISRLMRARAILAARDGDVDGAIATCAEMVRLAEIGLQDPLLIYLLARAAIVDQAVVTAQDVLTRGRAATGALRNLLSRLSAVPGKEELHRMFVGERAFGYSAYDLVRREPAQLNLFSPMEGNGNLGHGLLLRLIPDTVLELDSAHYLSLLRRTIELAKLPYREARSDWSALEGELEDGPWYAVIAPMAIAAFPMVARRWTMHEARVEVARLGLSLELHVREHGALPATFADLPLSLPVDDPFSDSPYVLKTMGDGEWRVYSVGPDGKDDGGVPLDDDEQGDLVWRHVPTP